MMLRTMALVKLRMLHPKKYRFIDESARGDQQVYGYLANEVQEVLPDAILEHTPNGGPKIYQLANVSIPASSHLVISTQQTSIEHFGCHRDRPAQA